MVKVSGLVLMISHKKGFSNIQVMVHQLDIQIGFLAALTNNPTIVVVVRIVYFYGLIMTLNGEMSIVLLSRHLLYVNKNLAP